MAYRFLRFPGGKTKAVTFSYDDGNRHDLRLVQTLDRYGIKCTFNITNASVQNPPAWYLNTEDITQHLLEKGHEIAVHGAQHKAPGKCTPIEGIRDVLENRLALERAFGRIIRGMAYPDSGITCFDNGATYANIRQYLQDLGIAYARTLGADNNTFALPQDWYAWVPTAHHANPELPAYMDEFLRTDPDSLYIANRGPRLFYLWGHSFEFENAGNWDLLETICQTLSGHDEIWYATNIEIFEYVSAYRSLIFSADGNIVYNPTLYTIWFDVSGQKHSIAPGQTLSLI